jgi:hypothetical protein
MYTQDELKLMEENNKLRSQVDDLVRKGSCGMFFVCKNCRGEVDKRSEEATATKWKQRYDNKCVEMRSLLNQVKIFLGEK